MVKKCNDIDNNDPDTIKLLLEIKYKLGKIEAKLSNHEKLIYIILSSLIAIIVKVFLL